MTSMTGYVMAALSFVACILGGDVAAANAGEYAIRITSPAFWADLSGPRILIRGTVQGPPGAGRLVLAAGERVEGRPVDLDLAKIRGARDGHTLMQMLGLVAAVEGDQFAVFVPAREGENVVTVTAGDAKAEYARTSVTVRVADAAHDASRLDSNPAAGAAPLTVSFNQSLRGGDVDFDFEGDGVVDATLGEHAELKHVYERPGLYVPTFRLHPKDGKTRTLTTIVDVYAPPDPAPIWNGLKSALRRGDVDAALEFVALDSRARYQPAFAALAADPAKAAIALGDIRPKSYGRGTIQCEMLRSEEGKTFSFPVTFVRDYDGLWRLKSL
jgi:hypothetical protein